MSLKTILMISGSLRDQSTNSAAVRTAAMLCPSGWQAQVYTGMGELPHFNPDIEESGVPASAADLRADIESADAVLFCTPEYAGSLPGSVKNLLDWTVGGVEIVGKPTGWINVSTNPGKAQGAHDTLHTVLGYTGAVLVDDACRHLPLARSDINDQGVSTKPGFVDGLTEALTRLTIAAEKDS